MFLAVPVCSTCNYPLMMIGGNNGLCQNCYNNRFVPVPRPIIVVPSVAPIIIPQRLRNDNPPPRINTYRKCFCCNSGASEIFTDRRGNNHFVCDKSYCNYELRRRYS